MCQRRQKSWIERPGTARRNSRQHDPEQEREADRHVGVAGEVEVELEGIAERRLPGLSDGRRGAALDGRKIGLTKAPSGSPNITFFASPSVSSMKPRAIHSAGSSAGRPQFIELRPELARALTSGPAITRGKEAT